jgi:hypothetical protein
MYNLTDSNFQSTTKNGIEKPWLAVFYLERCPHCVNAKSSLESLTQKEDFHTDIALIECSENVLVCMRFNVTRVPYIVYLDKNNMFEFNSYASENALNDFINEERRISSAKPIPTDLGYVGLFFKLLGEAVNMVNEYIKDYIKTKAQINFEWEMTHTIILFSIFLIMVIVVEYVILSWCCSSKKTKKGHVHTDNCNHAKKE